MNAPAIVWDANTEGVVRPVCEEALLFHLGIVPAWCTTLFVGYDAAYSGNSAAFIATSPEYRWARITICPGVLQGTAWEREEHLVHELFHIPLEPLHEAATDLRQMAKGQAPDAFLEEHWRRAWEGAVCDLTAMYIRMRRLYTPPEGA